MRTNVLIMKRGTSMQDKLTQHDITKIEEEIEYRKLVVRKEAIAEVKEMRAHGDLSENFEYHAAKKEKNKNEGRIKYLEKMVRNAIVVNAASKEGEVGLNKTVELYFEEDEITESYRLVTTVRGNSINGLISIESPIGKAIMGHKLNDRILIKASATYQYYVIIKSIQDAITEEEDKIRSF